MKTFEAENWYWKLSDGTVWSTKNAAFVEESEAQAWADSHNMAIPDCPKGKAGNRDNLALIEALCFYKLPMGELKKVVPKVITQRQCRIVLYRHGTLGAVVAILNQLKDQDETAGTIAEIEWDYASEIRRDNPLFDQIATALGLTSDDVDDLFIEAALI